MILHSDGRIFPSRIIQLPLQLLQWCNLTTYDMSMLLEADSSLSLSHLQLNDTRSVMSQLGLIGSTQILTRIHRRGLEVLISFLFPNITPSIVHHPFHRLFCLSFPHCCCRLCRAAPHPCILYSAPPPLFISRLWHRRNNFMSSIISEARYPNIIISKYKAPPNTFPSTIGSGSILWYASASINQSTYERDC